MNNLYTKDTLKHYLHNPLGILGMFITLCYLIAGIVFSIGLGQLQGDSERLPFIYFIIGFPLVILIAFLFLVICHHEKLYSPQDFSDEANFVKLTGKETTEKLREEAVEIISNGNKGPKETKNVTEKVHALMPIVENVEKLAVKKIESIYGIQFQREVQYVLNRHRYIFDAFAQKDEIFYIFECKYVRNAISRERLRSVLEQMLRYKQMFKDQGIATKFIVAFVLDEFTEKRQHEIIDFYSSVVPEMTVYVFDFKKLKVEFSTES